MILLHSQFHYSFPPLLYLSMNTFSFHSDYSYTLTHVQQDYSYACSCAYSCAALLTDVLPVFLGVTGMKGRILLLGFSFGFQGSTFVLLSYSKHEVVG